MIDTLSPHGTQNCDTQGKSARISAVIVMMIWISADMIRNRRVFGYFSWRGQHLLSCPVTLVGMGGFIRVLQFN